MAAILKKLWDSYYLVTETLPDPRTKTMPLVSKPFHGLTILAIYVIFVLKWGPKWMKNRPPYNIDKLLIVYNITQVVACAYSFFKFLWTAWGWDYKWVCEPVDYTVNTKSQQVIDCVYIYYLLKYLDLFDTIFFVLRKKFTQVSFLHLFHHSHMVVLAWAGITFFPGGHCTLIGLINSFVHVVMYSYYLLTVLHPGIKQSLWWKKHLTQLQIAQLAIVCVHFSTLLLASECKYPWWIAIVLLPGNFFLLLLFLDFYIKAYVMPKEKKEK